MEEGVSFYSLRNADGTLRTTDLFAEFDLALRAARCCASATVVEVWCTTHRVAGFFSEAYVTTAFPYMERLRAQATAIEVLD